MSKLTLSAGFQTIPEGTYVFYIYNVTYDETFGKMEVSMITAEGMKHKERFSLKSDNDEINEKAMNAFSYFAKTALNNFDLEEIDHTDLIGHYILGQIVHTVLSNRNKPGQTVTFANMGDKAPADGFDHEPVPSVAKMINAPNVDLDALLG